MLEVKSLNVLNLDPISFELERGHSIAIGGPSGSGKSMILKSIADLCASDGEIILDGMTRDEMSGPAWRRLVRYVAAEPGWWAETALEHFSDPDYAKKSAGQLGLSEEHLTRPIDRLSTGERQRLAFVRALEDQPKVLLLDEPTASLDEDATARAEGLMKAALGDGVHVILVSHDADQLARFGGRRFALSGHRFVAVEG